MLMQSPDLATSLKDDQKNCPRRVVNFLYSNAVVTEYVEAGSPPQTYWIMRSINSKFWYFQLQRQKVSYLPKTNYQQYL